LHRSLLARYGDLHRAEHVLMEALPKPYGWRSAPAQRRMTRSTSIERERNWRRAIRDSGLGKFPITSVRDQLRQSELKDPLE
jgi:hypothetical protein